MPVRIITDSTSYLPEGAAEESGIVVVPLSVTLGGITRAESEVDTQAFLRQMRETGEFPKTSQPTPGEMAAVFEAAVEAGDDVVGVFISSDMSGTFSSAQVAAERVRAAHPGARIELVDSRSNCMDEGFAVLAAARVARAGGSAEEAAEAARASVLRSRWYFTVETLDYLKMGGRIGAASALLAALLKIHPVLTVSNGVTDSAMKVRTYERALGEIVRLASADIAAHGFEDAVVHHAGAEEAAARISAGLAESVGKPVPIVPIGPVIAAHVGPGSLGVVYKCLRPLERKA